MKSLILASMLVVLGLSGSALALPLPCVTNGWDYSVCVIGDAHGLDAVTVVGDASSPCLTVNCVAVAGVGNAYSVVAVAGVGNAQGCIVVSGAGDATGDSGCSECVAISGVGQAQCDGPNGHAVTVIPTGGGCVGPCSYPSSFPAESIPLGTGPLDEQATLPPVATPAQTLGGGSTPGTQEQSVDETVPGYQTAEDEGTPALGIPSETVPTFCVSVFCPNPVVTPAENVPSILLVPKGTGVGEQTAHEEVPGVPSEPVPSLMVPGVTVFSGGVVGVAGGWSGTLAAPGGSLPPISTPVGVLFPQGIPYPGAPGATSSGSLTIQTPAGETFVPLP